MPELHELPLHDATGVRAIGLHRDGRPIWPIAGGDGTDDPAGDPPAGDPPPDTGDPDEADDPPGDGTDWKTEAAKWKALARKHENQAKKNSEAARQLTQQEGASKTLEERLAQLERDKAESDARALRAEVAAAKGLTPAQATRLDGATREELEADADELLSAFAGKGKDDTSGLRRRPTEKLRPGAVPGAEPEETDPTKLAAMVPRG
jgi:hypothetical protein